MRLLLAEDNPVNRKMIALMLQRPRGGMDALRAQVANATEQREAETCRKAAVHLDEQLDLLSLEFKKILKAA